MLVPLDGDRHELRAFSDTSADPIVLIMGADEGHAFALAVADVLSALDAPGVAVPQHELTIDGRQVTITGGEHGLTLTVERPDA